MQFKRFAREVGIVQGSEEVRRARGVSRGAGRENSWRSTCVIVGIDDTQVSVASSMMRYTCHTVLWVPLRATITQPHHL